MVRWVRDKTGRCRERPHYDPEELDETCEAVVVEFHARIWTFDQAALPLFEAAAPPPPRCKRDAILGPDPVDWMEWQAGYASGAFLMPLTAVRRTVGLVLEERGLVGAVHVGAPAGRDLIRRVRLRFEVSEDAARVRLFKLGHLTERIPPRPFRLSS